MNKDFKIAFEENFLRLRNSDEEHIPLFNRGTLEVELYRPQLPDKENLHVHEKDEVYIIASGKSKFINAGEIVEVEKGDFLFVPTGNKHGFFELSEDFSTWVIFYGPKGGEQ